MRLAECHHSHLSGQGVGRGGGRRAQRFVWRVNHFWSNLCSRARDGERFIDVDQFLHHYWYTIKNQLLLRVSALLFFLLITTIVDVDIRQKTKVYWLELQVVIFFTRCSCSESKIYALHANISNTNVFCFASRLQSFNLLSAFNIDLRPRTYATF